jgi:hypothetical protein
LLLVLSFVTGACNSAAVIADIQKFSPVVINVLNLACVFTPAAPLCATGAALLNGTISKLLSALTTYEANVKAGTATSADWNDLNAIFLTFEQQSSDIFSLLHISNGGTQTEALAVEASAKALLAVIEALFPSAPAPVISPTPASAMRAMAVQPRASLFAAHLPAGVTFDSKWLAAWEKNYNKLVDAAKKANPTAKLSHVHSELATRLTLGRLK